MASLKKRRRPDRAGLNRAPRFRPRISLGDRAEFEAALGRWGNGARPQGAKRFVIFVKKITRRADVDHAAAGTPRPRRGGHLRGQLISIANLADVIDEVIGPALPASEPRPGFEACGRREFRERKEWADGNPAPSDGDGAGLAAIGAKVSRRADGLGKPSSGRPGDNSDPHPRTPCLELKHVSAAGSETSMEAGAMG